MEYQLRTLDDANATTSSAVGLALPANRLQGTLPPLAGLPHLASLDLSNSKAVGLDAASNIVGGTLEALCGLRHLETVSLGYNNFTGPLPTCAQNRARFVVLDVRYNYLEGATPNQVCSLGTLESWAGAQAAVSARPPGLHQRGGLQRGCGGGHGALGVGLDGGWLFAAAAPAGGALPWRSVLPLCSFAVRAASFQSAGGRY